MLCCSFNWTVRASLHQLCNVRTSYLISLCSPPRCQCEQQCVWWLVAAHRRPSLQPWDGVSPARPRGRPLPQELRGQTAAGPRTSQQPGREDVETSRRYSIQTHQVVAIFTGLYIGLVPQTVTNNPNISLSWLLLLLSPWCLPRSVSSDAAVPAVHQENCGQAETEWNSRPSPSHRGETVSSLPIRSRGRSNALNNCHIRSI